MGVPREQTEGVKTILRDDPKRVIIKLSMPIILGMSLQTLNVFADSVWVSGLGPNALSAMGIFMPFFMLAMGISLGISVGGGAALSKRIGAQDVKGADSVAAHMFLIMFVVGILYVLPLFVFLKPLSVLIGAGDTTELIVSYGKMMIVGIMFIFFVTICTGILAGEGDVKRSIYPLVIVSVLNIILEPVFIYVFGMGLVGAACAFLVSIIVGAGTVFYWLFVKKNAYISINLTGFKFSKEVVFDIGKVALPVIFSQISIGIAVMVWNIIIAKVAGTDGIAVYTAGGRVFGIALLPLSGFCSAVTSVTAAAFGARDFKRLETAYGYALKIGFIVETILAVAVFVFAPFITSVYNWSGQSDRIAHDLTVFIRVSALLYPALSVAITGAMFQGFGKGKYDLFFNLGRSFVFAIPLACVFSIIFDNGLIGIWTGMVVANWIIFFMAQVWSKRFLKVSSTRYAQEVIKPVVSEVEMVGLSS